MGSKMKSSCSGWRCWRHGASRRGRARPPASNHWCGTAPGTANSPGWPAGRRRRRPRQGNGSSASLHGLIPRSTASGSIQIHRRRHRKLRVAYRTGACNSVKARVFRRPWSASTELTPGRREASVVSPTRPVGQVQHGAPCAPHRRITGASPKSHWGPVWSNGTHLPDPPPVLPDVVLDCRGTICGSAAVVISESPAAGFWRRRREGGTFRRVKAAR